MGVASKEALRLFFGLFGFGREVEGCELVVREEPSKGGSLTGLAGATQYHHLDGYVRTVAGVAQYRAVSTYAKYPIGTYILQALLISADFWLSCGL